MAEELIYIDINDGLKRIVNNTKLYAKLLGKFKNEADVASIESALIEGNMEKAQTAVHALKGLSANLSLTELCKQTTELERQIKEKAVKPDQMEIIKTVYEKTLTETDLAIEQLV